MQTRSTGPRTESGKQRTRLNALRHGLTGQTVVLPTEDRNAYNQFSSAFFGDLQPQTAIERQLVQTIVDCSWRLNRLRAHEQNLLSLEAVEMESEMDPSQDDVVATASAAALAFEKHSKTLGNLSLYEQRISRAFDRAHQQLKVEQAERRIRAEQAERQIKAEQAERRANAAKTSQPAQSPQSLPETPTAPEFVFSSALLDAFSAPETPHFAAPQSPKPRLKTAAA